MTLSFLFLLFSLFSSKRPLGKTGGFLLLSGGLHHGPGCGETDAKWFLFFQDFAISLPNPIQNPGVYCARIQNQPLSFWTLYCRAQKKPLSLLAGRPKILSAPAGIHHRCSKQPPQTGNGCLFCVVWLWGYSRGCISLTIRCSRSMSRLATSLEEASAWGYWLRYLFRDLIPMLRR